MANKHIKRCSLSLVIREMQMKTPMRCLFTPTRMAVLRKTDSNKCWQRCGEWEPSYIAVGMYNGTATLKKSLAVSQKKKKFTV